MAHLVFHVNPYYLLHDTSKYNFKKENRDPEKLPKQDEDSESLRFYYI